VSLEPLGNPSERSLAQQSAKDLGSVVQSAGYFQARQLAREAHQAIADEHLQALRRRIRMANFEQDQRALIPANQDMGERLWEAMVRADGNPFTEQFIKNQAAAWQDGSTAINRSGLHGY